MTVQELLREILQTPCDWEVEIREYVHEQGGSYDADMPVRNVILKGGKKPALVLSTKVE